MYDDYIQKILRINFFFVEYPQLFLQGAIILNCTFKKFCKKKSPLHSCSDDSLENFHISFYLFRTNLNMKHPSLASNIDVCPTSNHFSLLSYLILIYTDTATYARVLITSFFIYMFRVLHAMETNKLCWKEIIKNREKKKQKKSLGKEIVKKFMMKKGRKTSLAECACVVVACIPALFFYKLSNIAQFRFHTRLLKTCFFFVAVFCV